MGCSRPGAAAVACALAATLLAALSLSLPYWSKLAVSRVEDASTGSSSSSTGRGELAASLELTFGVWGSCLTRQSHTAGDSLRGFLAQSTTAPPANASVQAAPLARATFTCASFLAADVVSIHCEAARGLSGGRCARVQHATASGLCGAQQPEAALWLAWNDDSGRNATRLASADVAAWLGFLPRACGALGHATAGLSVLSSVLSALGLLGLVAGVGCGAVESRLVHVGAVLELGAALSQAALAALWALQTRVLRLEGARFGCCFYLALASLGVHAVAAAAAMSHLRLEKDALLELLLEHADPDSVVSVKARLPTHTGRNGAQQDKADAARAVESTG